MGEGFAFFRWCAQWQSWIELHPCAAGLLLEDWADGVRDI